MDVLFLPQIFYVNTKVTVKLAFVKLASYEGTKSTENVKKLIGINEDLTNGSTVIILEDIIDTGTYFTRNIRAIFKD